MLSVFWEMHVFQLENILISTMGFRRKNPILTAVTSITHSHSASSRERVVAARADDDVMANATNTKQHTDTILISTCADDSARSVMIDQPIWH